MAFFSPFLTVLTKVIPPLGILMSYNRTCPVTTIRVDREICNDKQSDIANRKIDSMVEREVLQMSPH